MKHATILTVVGALLISLISASAPSPPPARFSLSSGGPVYQEAEGDTSTCTVGFIAVDPRGGEVALIAGHCDLPAGVLRGPGDLCRSAVYPAQAVSCETPRTLVEAEVGVDVHRADAGTYMYSEFVLNPAGRNAWGKWVMQDRGAISLRSYIATTPLIAGKYQPGYVLTEEEVYVGRTVCKYGVVTGETCGTIHAVGPTFVDVHGIHVEHGDSGGPVYAVDGNTAYPIAVVSHIKPSYQRMAGALVAPMLDEWGLRLKR